MMLPLRRNDGIQLIIFDCFILPFIAALLAIIPFTRRFGLGMLLASGIGWLLLGLMCAGAIR